MPGKDGVGWSERSTGRPQTGTGFPREAAGPPPWDALGSPAPVCAAGPSSEGTQPNIPNSLCSGADGVPSQAGAGEALLSQQGMPGTTPWTGWMGQGNEHGDTSAQLSTVPDLHPAPCHPAPLPLLLTGWPRGHLRSSGVAARAVLPTPARAGISLLSILTLSILETGAC